MNRHRSVLTVSQCRGLWSRLWAATGRYSRCRSAGDCGLCGADCGVDRHRSVLTVSRCRGLWTVWSRLWAATGRYSRCHSAGDCGPCEADCGPPQVGTHGVTVLGTVDCVEQTVGRHRSVLTVSQCRGLWTVWSRLWAATGRPSGGGRTGTAGRRGSLSPRTRRTGSGPTAAPDAALQHTHRKVRGCCRPEQGVGAWPE